MNNGKSTCLNELESNKKEDEALNQAMKLIAAPLVVAVSIYSQDMYNEPIETILHK